MNVELNSHGVNKLIKATLKQILKELKKRDKRES